MANAVCVKRLSLSDGEGEGKGKRREEKGEMEGVGLNMFFSAFHFEVLVTSLSVCYSKAIWFTLGKVKSLGNRNLDIWVWN